MADTVTSSTAPAIVSDEPSSSHCRRSLLDDQPAAVEVVEFFDAEARKHDPHFANSKLGFCLEVPMV